MAFKIAIASGKGGTGKTTIAANLYHFLSHRGETNVSLADCDVEEPNMMLFFTRTKKIKQSAVTQEIPVIEASRCSFCRKCVDYCEFNAILIIPPINFAEINPSLCHSCGACSVACEYDAIWVKEEQIGTITRFETNVGKGIMEGRLKIGSSMQTMVIRALKREINPEHDIVILDAPPGTSCPVVETISDADYIILVTEPTPFGLHDLKLMVDLVRQLNKPFGIIVNKSNLGNREVYDYLKTEKIELLGEIPFSKTYASHYADGELFENIPAEIEEAFHDLLENISEKAGVS